MRSWDRPYACRKRQSRIFSMYFTSPRYTSGMTLAQLDVTQSAGLAKMKLAMNRLNVSRRWVGQQVDVSGEHIGEIINGRASPGGALLFRLAALFKFDPGLWGKPYDGDVSAIVVVEKRGRPRSSKGVSAACTDTSPQLAHSSVMPSAPRVAATGKPRRSRAARRRSPVT